jgi:hypothetical protein
MVIGVNLKRDEIFAIHINQNEMEEGGKICFH